MNIRINKPDQVGIIVVTINKKPVFATTSQAVAEMVVEELNKAEALTTAKVEDTICALGY